MTRRALAAAVGLAAVVGAVGAVIVLGPIRRGPSFHLYADQRTWLGIPHAGDVVSNLGFVVVGIWGWIRDRPADRTTPRGLASVAALGVIAIGLGSATYHWHPADTTLQLDWLPIGLTLMIVVAAVVRDRFGRRASHVVVTLAPVIAGGAVLWWRWSGGTYDGAEWLDGRAVPGDMAPYVAVQALGVGLPAVLAAIAPGTIRTGWLVLAVVGFALARLLAAHDAGILDAIGVSGHSLKHLAAAVAAGFALRALTPRRR